MKILLLIFAALSQPHAYAETCQFKYKKESTIIKWTAFKTPKKVGVSGKFTSFDVKTAPAQDINTAIKNATFSINTGSVDSGAPDRDNKIKKYFFSVKNKPITIAGKVVSMDHDQAKVQLNINGHKKDVMLKLQTKDNHATLSGKIDVLDFKMDSNLHALNEACKVLHEGKTWSDVEISIQTDFEKDCKK